MKMYYELYELSSKLFKRVFSHVINKVYQLYFKVMLA